MPIKLLSPITISRIAAGEVVERPASAVKELVENSIDAGATKIDIVVEQGGRNLISVADNGSGMSKEDLSLAVERHATSKLNEEDLFNILHFGFRGEALPSIASVSRMTITSKQASSEEAWSINIQGGSKAEPIPASSTNGTTVIIRDLFFATPARLKFLKSERTETQQIVDTIKRIAIAHPHISFKVLADDKLQLQTLGSTAEDATSLRMNELFGNDFSTNSVKLDFSNKCYTIKGFASLPTYNRGTSTEQYLFVNNRTVRDKVLLTAIKIAYQDFLARDRHPVAVLFLDLPPEEVDVNVHPTKAEVRFRDSEAVKGSIITALRNSLNEQIGYKASSTISNQAINSFKPSIPQAPSTGNKMNFSLPLHTNTASERSSNFMQRHIIPQQVEQKFYQNAPTHIEQIITEQLPLGFAKCQLYGNYIVAQTPDSMVIVDQHAAHERLVYEELKKSISIHDVKVQRLLIPEIVELSDTALDKLLEYVEELKKLGLLVERFGNNAVAVYGMPALLSETNVKKLISDIADDLIEHAADFQISGIVEHLVETFACHHSVRSGRILNIEEMNALLRQMENTPHSGQCNHGRPTYIELKLSDIEKLFGRK
jgi:DNA mismatch repair protein MutL